GRRAVAFLRRRRVAPVDSQELIVSSFDRRLSQTLKKSGCVDDDQLASALAAATRDNVSLFDALVKGGVFDERELLGTVALETGVTPIDLDRVTTDPEVLESLSH